MKWSRRKKALLVAGVLLLIIAVVLYKLADRYLIEHVELVVPAASSMPDNPGQEEAPGSVIADDWNYRSGGTAISIRKVETGSGEDTVTYYVADLQLKDGASLQSAFAKNAFGRNIIENTSVIAANNAAVFAVNGDYYGFRNDGVIIRNGTLFRDEPARTGLALYADGSMKSYDETELTSASLLDSGVVNSFSFGPALLRDGAVADNLEQVKVDTNFGNRSIQALNPRTGIGLIAPGHYVFVVVDGRMAGYSKGMTLVQFARLFEELGCTEAYNLDGGGSSTMYFRGRVVNNPLGKQSERGVSDILYVAE
ncbi:MAG: phosphodiester glycosidase family protein [Paenibacillaceae bacterium]|nr:phosphodiester glycosidase family protein [Paenibacillaceae bacterium]